MTAFDQVRGEYNAQALGYNAITDLPDFILESQLIESALGDCTGLTVLDLGGGTGHHARQAVDAGAARVDVVDLSPEMLRVGREHEEKLGRVGRIEWFEGDATKSLSHLPLGQYDLVMSNFMFDHATTLSELESMWRNTVAYMKPGGRFIGAHVGNPRCAAVRTGKYGVSHRDHVDIPGGVRYKYKLHLREPIEFEASSLEISYSGSAEMPEKMGLVEVEEEPLHNASLIREDPVFWKEFTDDPSMAIMKARKPISAA